MIDLLVFIQCTTLGTLKVILIRFYRKNVSQIISLANNDWSTIKEPSLLNIMKIYASNGNFVYKAELIFIFTELLLLFVGSLPLNYQNNSIVNSTEILIDRPLPQGTKCLFVNLSTTMYILIYILQMIQFISTCIGNIGIDVFFFLLVMHLCGQLEILCEKICNIREENFIPIKSQIVILIERHKNLLRKAVDLEETYSLIIMLQLAVNVSSLSLLGIYNYFPFIC